MPKKTEIIEPTEKAAEKKKAGWSVKRKLILMHPPMEGEDVKAVQEALIAMNYHCGIEGANGQYNKHTAYAVRCFQSWARLRVTGIVDQNTVERLGGTWG